MKYTLMNLDMTKAILEGRKVQTRRVIKIDLSVDGRDLADDGHLKEWHFDFYDKENNIARFGLYGDGFGSEASKDIKAKCQIGETIWVREPARVTRFDAILNQFDYQYLADDRSKSQQDIPVRFVSNETDNVSLIYPKWIYNHQGIPNGCITEMARIFLRITNVRVEKLEDISYEDIVAEGFDVTLYDGTKGQLKKEAFKWWINLWNSTAPKGAKFNDGVYVFVYEFERVDHV